MERENFDFSHFSTFKKDGKPEKMEGFEAHMKKIDKENITYTPKLNLGDEVKLKGIDYTVIVKYIDYQVSGLGKVDYAGTRTDKADELLRLFNQKDILEVVLKNKNDNEIER